MVMAYDSASEYGFLMFHEFASETITTLHKNNKPASTNAAVIYDQEFNKCIYRNGKIKLQQPKTRKSI